MKHNCLHYKRINMVLQITIIMYAMLMAFVGGGWLAFAAMGSLFAAVAANRLAHDAYHNRVVEDFVKSATDSVDIDLSDDAPLKEQRDAVKERMKATLSGVLRSFGVPESVIEEEKRKLNESLVEIDRMIDDPSVSLSDFMVKAKGLKDESFKSVLERLTENNGEDGKIKVIKISGTAEDARAMGFDPKNPPQDLEGLVRLLKAVEEHNKTKGGSNARDANQHPDK